MDSLLYLVSIPISLYSWYECDIKLICSAEVDDLRKGFESVKCFSESASESLTVMLGSCSRFLFLLCLLCRC